MGYKLCTTEKPSVAVDIAKVIGATKRCDGYFEGNGYRVTWAVGHLVGLAEPEEYGYISKDEMWDKENSKKEEALRELPLIPNEFKLVVLEKTKKQFKIIENLINNPECEEIIDCGDAGAEGHILQWFIREKIGCNKKIRRFIATSMTKEAILSAMNNLHDIKEYERVIRGEFCKKKADWIMGMSMSRCESIIYNSRIDVGRVQSPTLYFVVQRYLAVSKFKSVSYYQIKSDFLDGFTAFWLKDNNNLIDNQLKDKEGRLLDEAKAKKLLAELNNLKTGVITKLDTNNKELNRPQLYDITELERDGNRIFGYTAEEVLQTAQSLYETHKITSYPRTDSRFITSDLEGYMLERIKQISTIDIYNNASSKVIEKGLNIDKRIVNDSKVTDHHAIICTENIENFDISKLNEKEKNILHLIITRMLVAFSNKYSYKETILNVTFSNGIVLSASGKIPMNLGWKEIQSLLVNNINEDEVDSDTDNEGSQQLFKGISLNQKVSIKNIEVLKKETTAPKLHTEATLLTAMENAGSQIENGEILKGKGIGTQATRANIIKSLFDKGYITNKVKGKTKYLIPTKQGVNVIRVLPKELYSPAITANWEQQISKIVDGTYTEKEFMDNFKNFINSKVNFVKNNRVEGVDFSLEKEVIGECPFCKSDVVKGIIKDKENNKIDNYYCISKECKFSLRKDNFIFKMRTRKNLTLDQVKKLLKNGKFECKCISKGDKEYNGKFILAKNESGYSELRFELGEFKDKKKKVKGRTKE